MRKGEAAMRRGEQMAAGRGQESGRGGRIREASILHENPIEGEARGRVRRRFAHRIKGDVDALGGCARRRDRTARKRACRGRAG